MKRFISHEELARDSRFKRARSRGRLLESLPDDVRGVVSLMEHVAPKLRERVEGTELEKVYDDLGPGFPFLTQFGAIGPGDPNVETQLKVRLHGIFVGELQALEGAGRTLWDFPEAPWEFRMNMARQCWDEARHCQIYEKLLHRAGAEVGDYPETTTLFEAACADDPTMRVAGVNRCLEGLACDAFRAMIDYAKAAGDPVMEQAVDFVLADELTHVRFGSNWVKQFTRSDPEKFREAKAFQREVERRFSIGTGRSGAERRFHRYRARRAAGGRLHRGGAARAHRDRRSGAEPGHPRGSGGDPARASPRPPARRAGGAHAVDRCGGRRRLTGGARVPSARGLVLHGRLVVEPVPAARSAARLRLPRGVPGGGTVAAGRIRRLAAGSDFGPNPGKCAARGSPRGFHSHTRLA